MIRFGAKVLNKRQDGYAQVKRELWGVVSAIKSDREYLMGAQVVTETDCLSIVRMMRCCTILDVAMLRWIAYVKSLKNVRHISRKDNVVADMLSRARFKDDIVKSDNEEVPGDYFTSEHICRVNVIREFQKDKYEGKSLLIEKLLKEIGESSNNKEKRAKI